MWRVLRGTEARYDDLKVMGAPSECYSSLGNSVREQIQDIFGNDYSKAKEFVKECYKRCDGRFIFMMGLDILDIFPEFQIDFNLSDNKE